MLSSGSNSVEKGSLQGVGEAAEARQEQAKTCGVQGAHEHSTGLAIQPVLDDASATQVAQQRSVEAGRRCGCWLS